MTFAEWQAAHDVSCLRINTEGGPINVYQVFSRDPSLWHLDDYLVSSCLSGPSVLLVPRR